MDLLVVRPELRQLAGAVNDPMGSGDVTTEHEREERDEAWWSGLRSKMVMVAAG